MPADDRSGKRRAGRAGPIRIADLLEAGKTRELLILHRGGVIGADSPECSLRAATTAGEQGFGMLEIDIRESKDHVPVVFHDKEMARAAGVVGRVGDFTARELAATALGGTDQTIATLADVFAVCHDHGMGVMLDIKEDGTDAYYEEIGALLQKFGFGESAVAITSYRRAVTHLGALCYFPMDGEDFARIGQGKAPAGPRRPRRFWFGWPRFITDEMVQRIQAQGIPVVPSINTFHYRPEFADASASRDVARMRAAGVVAYQIDSVYAGLFRA